MQPNYFVTFRRLVEWKDFLNLFVLVTLLQNVTVLTLFQDPDELAISADDVSDKVDEMIKTIAEQAESRL